MLASTAAAQYPQDGYIGVFGPDLTCFIESKPFVPVTAYAAVALQGRTSNGITGAGFRITDIPGSWIVSAIPNPGANVILGNPLGDGVLMVGRFARGRGRTPFFCTRSRSCL
jgi:hypothetical protein